MLEFIFFFASDLIDYEQSIDIQITQTPLVCTESDWGRFASFESVVGIERETKLT